MKNLVIILSFAFAGLVACQKEKAPKNVPVSGNETPADTLDSPDNCGCGPAGVDTAASLSGVVRYEKTFNAADTVIHDQLWIISGGGGIYTHSMICSCDCNLPSEILHLKASQDTISSVNVIYSGKLRKPCWTPPINLGDIFCDVILTDIKVQ